MVVGVVGCVCVWVGGVNHVSRQFVCTCMVYGVV